MRIAFNTLVENPRMPSGSLDFYRQITRELANQDKQNEYFLFVSHNNRHLFQIEKGNVHLVNCFFSNERPLLRILASQVVIPYRLIQYKIDILFSPQNISAFYIPRRVRNIISIITTHHWKTPRSIGLIRSLYRKAISYVARRQANLIIANSLATKKDILENLKIKPDKVRVVYEGLDHSRFFPREFFDVEESELARRGIRKPFFLFVSTIWQYKNCHTLIEAYGKLCQKTDFPHLLVIVGRIEKIEGGDRKYKEYLMDICRRYEIHERVKFVGYVPNEVVAKVFQAADLYVQPSLHETFGKTIIEAFACGTPVIASNTSSVPEVVGDAGLLFDPYSSDELLEAMIQVLSNSQLRHTLVQRGLKRAKKFSFAKQANELIRLFEELV